MVLHGCYLNLRIDPSALEDWHPTKNIIQEEGISLTIHFKVKMPIAKSCIARFVL